MQLGGSTAAHAAVVGVGGVPGLAFGGGKYRCGARERATYVPTSAATCFAVPVTAAGLLQLPSPALVAPTHCPLDMCLNYPLLCFAAGAPAATLQKQSWRSSPPCCCCCLIGACCHVNRGQREPPQQLQAAAQLREQQQQAAAQRQPRMLRQGTLLGCCRLPT